MQSVINIGLLNNRVIEQNLHALCKTPKIYRQEFMSHVHRPVLKHVEYVSMGRRLADAPKLRQLLRIYQNLDIMNDPYIVRLMANPDPSSEGKLIEAIRTGRTYCHDMLKMLSSKAMHIHAELGAWAADYYISSTVGRLRAAFRTDQPGLSDWASEEKTYLLDLLDQAWQNLGGAGSAAGVESGISHKVEVLMDLLLEERRSDFAGIIFVQQRAIVFVLAQLISRHPRTRDIFRCGTFIGTSVSAKRSALIDLLDPRGQKTMLDDLRAGVKNLIIGTSVLEEGIDITACNTVICFDEPANLKSFIQRRGRARQAQSQYIIMVEANSNFTKTDKWEELEEAMKEAYLDDMRELKRLQEIEDSDEEYNERYVVPSTG